MDNIEQKLIDWINSMEYIEDDLYISRTDIELNFVCEYFLTITDKIKLKEILFEWHKDQYIIITVHGYIVTEKGLSFLIEN